jgi:uroporphyrinogen decarboxylase
MNSRERLLAAINHQEPDRVPLWLCATQDMVDDLCRRLGAKDGWDLARRLGCDTFALDGTWIHPLYNGPELEQTPNGEKADYFGIVLQKRWPLAFAQTLDDLERYRWPQAEWFDYSTVGERARQARKRDAVVIGGEGSCGIYHSINLRGYTQALIDPLAEPEIAQAYLSRMGDFFVEWNRRWLMAGEGFFDIFRCGDEVGNMERMLLNPGTWRAFHKPRLERVWGVAKAMGLHIWWHCCGCCRPVFEDMIEIGVDMWDPAPPNVAGNDLAELKRLYGRQITFVGGINHAGVLCTGTPADVEREVRLRLDQLAPGGGLILGPAQGLTVDIPTENILTMYETALKYGEY